MISLKSMLLGVVVALAYAVAAPSDVVSAELKPHTLKAFEEYVRLTEARIANEVRQPSAFLRVDTLADAQRSDAYTQMRNGQVFVERLNTQRDGKDIDVPDGLVHHWMGTVFIPGGTLQKTLALVQDYDNHKTYYKPDVIASRLVQRKGNDFKIFLRFYRKKVITVVLNTEHDVHYIPLDATRQHTRSYTTRIAEVQDADNPDGPERPVGYDHGFLWRLYSYWRFQEKDGGVYVQCEAVSLTRSIPFAVSWIVKPFITSVPRESLAFTLNTTRAALVKKP